ncbi:MAG: hypothetical protein ABIF17_03385 [Patescibacteria group bacterium]
MLKNKINLFSLAILLVVAILLGTHKIDARVLKTKLNEIVFNESGSEQQVKIVAVGVNPYVYFYPDQDQNKPYVYFNDSESNQEKASKIRLKSWQELNQKIDKNLAKRLAGRFLLQTEQQGAIWYVDKKENKIHQITLENAIPLFERYAVGITNKDLDKIPVDPEGVSNYVDSDKDGYGDLKEIENGYSPFDSKPVKVKYDTNLANRLAGNFLLQVEQGGAIWYIDSGGVRHIVRTDTLLDLFGKLSLGITNQDLFKIPSE